MELKENNFFLVLLDIMNVLQSEIVIIFAALDKKKLSPGEL